MKIQNSILTNEEKIIFTLRAIYDRFGYSLYKMSKFEPYDLYVRNKDFLISDHVITFTDVNGKLMALKPDVTLSIIKNSKDEAGKVEKLYYNENVYRVAGAGRNYREIMQVGLECIGDIDETCVGEVVTLALQSLRAISSDFVLDLSHPGIVTAITEGMADAVKGAILKCVGEKNRHELALICRQNGVDQTTAELLDGVIGCYGTPDAVLAQLQAMALPAAAMCAVKELEALVSGLADRDNLRIDLSSVSNTKYYNGITFKGFINGVPESVLSGGRYDKLLARMGRTSGAIGFAVYLDALERFVIEEVGE
ncbi:MAG: ATP phosphoribosyltransferase regulatory subunit [Clostridia bacterium]|nr:ATP phosphoribosyltransferase regulatory subunit [Clostridia bacterium]